MLLPWFRRPARPAADTTRSRARRPRFRPRMEALEDRIAPAFTLTLSFNPTSGVMQSGVGTTTFTAISSPANLNWTDVAAALATGNVVVDSGSGGTEAGDITDLLAGGININNKAGTSLTFQSGSGVGLVGNVSLGTINLLGANSSVVITANNDVSTATLEQSFGQLTSVSITAGGTVNDGSIMAGHLAVQAGSGIGTSGPLVTRANNLVAQTTSGDVVISNTGALTIGFTGEPFAGVSSTGGAVTLSTSAGDLTVNEAVSAGTTVSLTAGSTAGSPDHTLTNAATITGTGATLTADRMALDTGTVGNGLTNVVTLQPATAGRTIDLGGASDPVGTLTLSAAEVNTVTAGVLRVGGATAGGLSVTGPISPAGTGTLSLQSGGAIGETGGGSVQVTELAAQGAGGVNLATNVSTVSTLAGSANNQPFQFTNAGDLVVGTVDGVTGLTTAAAPSNAGGAINVTLLGFGSLLTVGAAVGAGSAGPVALAADGMDLTAGVSGNGVTLQTASSGRSLSLVAAPKPAGTLALTSDDLNEITSTNGLTLATAAVAGGSIIVATAITAPATWSALTLSTSADIADTTGGATPSLTVPALTLLAGTGIGGTTMAGLTTQTPSLQFHDATSGTVTVTNTGALAITGDSSAPGTVTVTSVNSGGPTDDSLTVSSGVTLQTTGGDVVLSAATDLNMGGATVQSPAGALNLTALTGDLTLGSHTATTTLTATSVQGSIRDDGNLSTFVKAPNITLKAAKAVGGDTAISPADVLAKDAIFRQAIDFYGQANALTIMQGPAGGNIQLRDVNGTFNSTVFVGGYPVPVGTGKQLALIASGGAVGGTAAGDLVVDAALTLAPGKNVNLLLAATDGNGVKANAVVTNSATSSPTALVAGGTGSVSNPTATAGTAQVLANSINLVTAGGAVGTAILPMQVSGLAGQPLALNGNSAGGDIAVTDTGAGGVVVGRLSAGAGTVTLNELHATITSASPSDGVADILGQTVTLSASNAATGQIGSFTTAAQFVEVQAATLNAGTNNSRLWVAALGGAAVGSVSAGTDTAILKTVNGDLTSTHAGATPDVTADTVILVGSNGSFGSAVAPLLTKAGTLQATVTGTGSINVANVPTGGDLSIGQAMTANGAINLAGAGALVVAGGVSAGGGAAVGLSAGTTITETTGSVTGGALTTSSSGGTTLDSATNAVASLKATNTGGGGVTLSDNVATLALNDITSGGPLSVTNTGAIAVAGTVSAGAAAVGLSAGAAITETGSLTGGALATASVGGTTLGSAANGVASFKATNTGGGGVTLSDSVATLALNDVASGGPLSVANTGAVAVAGAVDAGGAAVGLSAGGTITETTGSVTGGALTTTSSGGTALGSAANAVTSLKATNTAGGGVTLNDSVATLTLNDITSGGPLSVTNTGAIAVAGAVDAGGAAVGLSAGGTITETGSVTGGALTTSSSGGTTLGGAGNAVVSLKATNTGGGGVTLNDSVATLTLNDVSSGGPLSVANTGAVAVAGAVSAGGAAVGLSAGGTITETGSLAGGALTTTSSGGTALGSAANAVTSLKATNTAGGGVTLNDSVATLTLNDVSSGGPLSVANAGAIAVAGAVSAGGAAVGLSAGGTITEPTGSVTGGALTTSSAGGTTLGGAGNGVSSFKATNTGGGGVTLSDNVATLTLNDVASGGPLSVTNTTGAIAVAGAVSAGAAAVGLSAGTTITETGSLTGGALTTSSAGGTTLGSATNNVTSFAASDTGGGNITLNDNNGSLSVGPVTTGGGLTVTNTGSVGVGGVSAGSASVTAGTSISVSGGVSAGSVGLSAGTTIAETGGSITGDGTLTTNSSGGTTLTGTNHMTGFNAINAGSGDVQLTNADALSIGGVNQTGGGNVTVNNTGALTTTGPVTTAANGGISLTATDGTLTVGAAVSAGGSGAVTLTATGGTSDVVLNATVGSGSGDLSATADHNVTLNAGGFSTAGNVNLTGTQISEAGAGFISAASLSTNSAADTSLDSNNAVSTFSATATGGNISLSDNVALLTVTGVTQNGSGNVSISNAGDLSVTGAIKVLGSGSIALTTTAGGAETIGAPLTAGGAAGKVTLTNAGLLSLKADVTAPGGFTQSGAGAVQVSVAQVQVTTTNHDANFASDVTLNGNLVVATGTGAAVFGGTVKVSAAGLVLTIDTNAPPTHPAVFNGKLTGAGGLLKKGTGVLLMKAGPTYDYTGDTTLQAGTLLVDGTLGGSKVVLSGASAVAATLAGTGSVKGIVAATGLGGTVAPGDSGAPGRLSSNGDVTLSPNVILQIRLNGKGTVSAGRPVGGVDYDQLNVSGKFSASGALLTPTLGAKSNVDDVFVIVKATTSDTTQFALVTNDPNKFDPVTKNPLLRKQQFPVRYNVNVSDAGVAAPKPFPAGSDVVMWHQNTAPAFKTYTEARVTSTYANQAGLSYINARLVDKSGKPLANTIVQTDTAKFTWTFTDPDELDVPLAAVDFGDGHMAGFGNGHTLPAAITGSPGTSYTLTASNRYTDPLNATIVATVSDAADAGGNMTDPVNDTARPLKVLDAPMRNGKPVVPNPATGTNLADAAGRPVLLATFTDDVSTKNPNTFLVSIQWDSQHSTAAEDNSKAAGKADIYVKAVTVGGLPAFAVYGRHDYKVPGRFLPRITITSDGLSTKFQNNRPANSILKVTTVAYTGAAQLANSVGFAQLYQRGAGSLDPARLALLEAIGVVTPQAQETARRIFAVNDSLFSDAARNKTVNTLIDTYGLGQQKALLSRYVQFLAHGGTRQQLAALMWTNAYSMDYAGRPQQFLIDLFNKYLTYWQTYLHQPAITQNSPEFKTLMRVLNTSGAAAAVNLVVFDPPKGVLPTSGNRQAITDMYATYLNNPISAPELSYWLMRLSRTSLNQVYREFLMGPPAAGFPDVLKILGLTNDTTGASGQAVSPFPT